METQENKPIDSINEIDNHLADSQTRPQEARLVCTDCALDSSLANLNIDLDETEETIGRADTNSIIIDYMRVSRRHARIFPYNGEWVIEDVSSTNGIFISDMPITQTTLNHGDQILIASIPFRFEYKYNDSELEEDSKPAVMPTTVRKQLNQNPEATIVLQSSPFGVERTNKMNASSHYGWLVAFTIILLLSAGVISSILS